ncbi:MAG: hypothetical protein RCO49_05960 [Rickettsia endosymbiont of Argas persicus]
MPVPENKFDRLIEVYHKNLELFINPGNRDVINSNLAFNYLGKILEEQLEENPELPINDLPVLIALIQKYSKVNKKLPYDLKNCFR